MITLFSLFSLGAFAQDSCQEYARNKVETIMSTNYGLTSTILGHLEDNLYFNCKLGFSSVESWFCIDKRVRSILLSSSAIHFNTKLQNWYEIDLGSSVSPEVNSYELDNLSGQVGRFNHFKLASNYKIMIEKNNFVKHKLNGIKLDDRVSLGRKFVNITCYDVGAFL